MKKKIAIAIVIVVALLLIVGVLVYVMTIPVVNLGDVAFETVQRDFHGGVEVPKNVAITDEAAWTTLWNQMSANITPKPPAPEIDFANELIVGVFMGTKSTGGYSTEVTRIAKTDAKITVYIREVSPGPNCAVTLALTVPYHIVKMQKVDGDIDFSVTKDVTECPAP
ncbi:MAG: protease complex subunit PrcB family protein [Patescibacteria group bacterium]